MILSSVSVDKILKHDHEKEIISYNLNDPSSNDDHDNAIIYTETNTSRRLFELGLPVVVPVEHTNEDKLQACLVPVFFFFINVNKM